MLRIDPVATHAGASPNRPAIVDAEDGRRWTYRELDRAVDRLAAVLAGQFGPASGVRIATLARNCPEMVILQLACMRAGAIFVPFNWRLAPSEIAVLAQDAAPEIVFHDPELAVPAAVPRAWPIGELLNLGEEGARPAPEARRPFEAVTTLLYTSGTSGRPKGVMLSDANAFWGCTNFIGGNDVSCASVFLCDMPLFHTAGLFAATRVPLQAGAVVLISRGFDPDRTLARLADPALGVTHYFSVPQMAATIWNRPDFEPAKLRSLVSWTLGGAPNPRAQTERFVGAGVPILEGFGMTETGSNFGMPPHDLARVLVKAGSCGLPFLAIEAKIADDAGNALPDGEKGELWLRGPSVSQGYWNQPELTAQAFRDGWFLTGDAAVRDADGFYSIVDRKKDMFISGGENVYPAEVEAALAELAEVAEAAVVGVPDARWGEVGRAYVVPVAGREITAEQVVGHCLARLAKFKVPASVVITDQVPRTASGKVQKHVLRDRALAEMSEGGA